jgi:hypothetical protein
LQKHLRGPCHQKNLGGTSSGVEEEAEEGVHGAPPDGPTNAQLLITLKLIKKDPLGASANDFVDACAEARGSGDLKNVPAFRCSKNAFPRNVSCLAAATLEEVHKRILSKGNPVKFMCWAEDGAGRYEQMMCRTVYKNREEEDLLIDWHAHEGKKTGIERAEAMEAALTSFGKNRPAVKEVFKKNCKVFEADGEQTELVTAVCAKMKDFFDFKYAGRCLFHAKQGSMKKAVETVESFSEWLDLLVRDYSDRGNGLGGLCRALAARDRLRHKFADDVEFELKTVLTALRGLGEEWTGR